MKIVILGGGTAGWLAALFLSKNHPDKDITVLASSKIGVIGAGEGVTGELMDVVAGYYGDFGIDPEEFFRETSAMPKYGIMHKDWTDRKGFQYFGPIDGTLTGKHLPDAALTYMCATDPDRLHLASMYGRLYDQNVSPISKVTDTVEISTYGFHFDARLAAKFLEKTALKFPNCKLLDREVKDVVLNDIGNVEYLITDEGTHLNGDFFIDASGFSRIIINKLKGKWISYKENLPLNAAIPFFQDYEDNEVPKCYSVAWAQSSGWYWEAGVQHRKGCGYVYCDDFITQDQALEEIETNLGKKVKPLTHFKFDTGRLENTWIKNCLAIGLAAAFAEPLEATSIHSTIKQLSAFTFEYLKDNLEDTINPSSLKFYNQRMNTMFDDFKDFLVSHYLGGRNDSEFWKYITSGKTSTDFATHLKEMCKSRVPTIYDFPSYPGSANWLIWGYILVGTGQLSKETAQRNLNQGIIDEALYSLDHLSIFSEKTRLTHYSFEEYFSTIKSKSIKFIPKRGVEWHIGNIF